MEEPVSGELAVVEELKASGEAMDFLSSIVFDDEKPVFEKRPLVWEEDPQLTSMFLDRKEEIKVENASYLQQHPELRSLMADFLQFLLLRKPSNVFEFARDYFLPFASRRPPEGTFNASSSSTTPPQPKESP